jgi:para-nitrobenzyl esterase
VRDLADPRTGRNVRRWAAIPYALPPIGPRRFQPPEPVLTFDPAGAYDDFGPSAPQITEGPLLEAVPGMRVGLQDEERCLTLNVWAPEGAHDLPVMVWIHGGAFAIGGSSLETYDATHLAAAGDVVVVSCNYRVGALGFLTLPGVSNNGLRDQQAALQWVQANIATFGGDPANVTVFGESAGAGALLHLLSAPSSRGLFRRAILQSPGAETVPRALGEQLGDAFLARAGVDAAGLAALDVEVIVAAQEAAVQDLAGTLGSMPWQPVADGELLPDDPRGDLAGGAARDVDVLLGGTTGELGLYTGEMASFPPDTIALVLRQLVTPALGRDPGIEACQVVVEMYGKVVDGDQGDTYAQVLSDAAMVVPTVRLLDDMARHGRVWNFAFDWSTPGFGPCHAADLPFTFGTLDRCGWDEFVGADDEAWLLSDFMIESWARFARTGDPGWPRWDERRQTMILGREQRVDEHPVAARLHLHDELR